jgi:ferredoxin-NADP reductase
VSSWLHDHVRAGDVLRLSPPAGEFVLPEPTPAKLLLLSGGSGVTPVMSIVRDLAARGALHDVVFVHHARRRQDVAFRAELEALAARRPGLRLLLCVDDEPDGAGGFDEARLRRQVPDLVERTTFLCGPPGLMARVEAMWAAAGLAARLRREHFVVPETSPLTAAKPTQASVEVRLAASRRRVVVDAGVSLLEALERAGERPANGCRIGICNTCRCRKQRGAVLNLATGEVSNQPDEDIRLCVSRPLTDLELGL